MNTPTPPRVSEERLPKIDGLTLATYLDMCNDYNKMPPKHGPYFLTFESWKAESIIRELQHLRSQLPAAAASYSHATPASAHGYGQPEAADRSETGSEARDAADARRYRWMRKTRNDLVKNISGGSWLIRMRKDGFCFEIPAEEELDAACDSAIAAIAAEREGQSHD